MFINYAHRGASEYEPENTLRSFKRGLEMGANGIETDVQLSADGELVLFHDKTMLRVTGVDAAIADFTLEELRAGFEVKNEKYPEHTAKIATLEELLTLCQPLSVELAVELKADGTEKAVLDMIDSFGMKERCIITSFDFTRLETVKRLDPSYKIGYLTDKADAATVEKIKSIGGEQICPKADILDKNTVGYLKAQRLSVRAWGVKTQEIMRAVYSYGVDGMTVNFPDKLTELINESI